jgi:DNA-binding SARP family transcriptional activator
VLDEDQELPSTDDPSPLPLLLTVGVDDAQLLVNLEAFGVVALVGDLGACQRLARSFVAELATRTEDTVAVELVGDVLDDAADRFDGVRRRAGWDDVDPSLVAMSAGLLETGGWPHTFAARSSGRIYDGWPPTVWITEATTHPALLDTVSALARRPGSGAAVLVVGDDPGHGLRIHLDEAGRFQIPALGLDGDAQGIEAGVVEQLTTILVDADEPATEQLQVTLPVETGEPGSASADHQHGGSESPDYRDLSYRALVRLCGTIRIDGVDEHLTQRELAIATYVAFKGSADVDQLRDAVWNGVSVSRKTVQNSVSVVKSKLGPAVRTVEPGNLRAADDLVTDIELIRRRLAQADASEDPNEKITLLAGAVELVTGPVCGYPERARSNWRWLVHDNWRSYVEALVTTATTELARAHLEAGQLSEVRAVVQKGIDAVGRREDLIVLLTKSYEAAGDHDTARSIIREHEAYLADLGVDEFNEQLLDLLDRYATPAHHKTN